MKGKASYLLGLALMTGLQVSIPAWPISGGNFQKTLATLKKADDFPLYVMRYIGDYGFKERLKEGSRSAAHIRAAVPAPGAAWACSCFSIPAPDGRVFFGRNFDWYEHAALLLFTDPPDGYAAAALVDLSYLGYGREDIFKKDLIGLRQAPEYPFDGLNEKGLAVGMMAVPRAEGGRDPKKATIDDLQAIRLMLDYAKNVGEAAALLDGYNIDFGSGPPVHFLVADAAGDSAVLEFIDGRMRIVRGRRSFHLSTNFTLFPDPPENGRTSCWRYNKIFETLSAGDKVRTLDDAMALLRDVSQSSAATPTIWSAAFDLKSGEIRIAMGRQYDKIHSWNLFRETTSSAMSPESPVWPWEISGAAGGETPFSRSRY